MGCKSAYSIPSKLILGLTAVLFGVLVTQVQNLGYGQDYRSLFYTPSDSPYGIPYGEWITKYWDWWASIPASETPAEHKGKYHCFMQDVDDVAFLVDPLQMHIEETYSCKIAYGKPIFFPLVASEYDTGVDGYENATDKELVDSAIDDDNSKVFRLTINGKAIPSDYIRNLRAESPFWNLTLVEGNHYEGKPGTFRAFAEGFYIFLRPLPPGLHQISYEASSSEPNMQVSLAGKMTYNLFVNSTTN